MLNNNVESAPDVESAKKDVDGTVSDVSLSSEVLDAPVSTSQISHVSAVQPFLDKLA